MIIGIIGAIKDEADIIATALDLQVQDTVNTVYHIYTNASKDLVMITPGENKEFITSNKIPIGRPGKVSAGIVTTILIEQYHPDVIINAGTAAGVALKGINIGDIVVADFVANHDIRIPIDGYKEYGERKIPLQSNNLLKQIHHPYKIGTISSAESFTSTKEEWDIMRKNDVMAKEMEAAGVLLAVEILNYTKPVVVIKALTDKEDENSSDEEQTNDFAQNFEVAMINLSTFLAETIQLIKKA